MDKSKSKSSFKRVKIEKKSEGGNDENFNSNIQYDNNNTQTKTELKNNCKKELDLNLKEEGNIFGENSTVSNKISKVDKLKNKKIPDQKHSSVKVKSTKQNIKEEKVVRNKIKVSNINTSQVTTSQLLHLPASLPYYQLINVPAASAVVGLMPTIPLTSTTVQQRTGIMGVANQNSVMQFQPARMSTANGFFQSIPGHGNIQLISAVQPTIHLLQPTVYQTVPLLQPTVHVLQRIPVPITVNTVELHQSTVHQQIIQSTGNITVSERKQQAQPQQHQQQIQTQEVLAETPPQRQHNVSNKSTTDTIKQENWVVPCTCPNCTESERSRDVTGKLRHVCHFSDCKRTYNRVASLRAHLRSHESERLFACTWKSCNKKFTSKNRLQRHSHSHTGSQN